MSEESQHGYDMAETVGILYKSALPELTRTGLERIGQLADDSQAMTRRLSQLCHALGVAADEHPEVFEDVELCDVFMLLRDVSALAASFEAIGSTALNLAAQQKG